MVRVGMITGEYPPLRGGVADYTQRLVGALRALDVVPSVLTSQRAATEPQDPSVLPRVRRWDRSIWRLVAQLAQRQRWDLVHIQYQPAAYELRATINLLPLALHRSLPHLKVVTTFHDLRVPYLFPKSGPLRQLMVRLLANRSDAVIAVAAEDVPLLWRWHTRGARLVFRSRPAAPATLAHIAVGNNLDAPPPVGFDRDLWRARIGATTDTLVVGHIGFINRSKGVDVLVRALARLLSQGLDVRVLMIGEQVGSSDTENVRYLAEVMVLIERLRLQPYVHWTGFQRPEALAAWLRCTDVAALPFLDGASQRRTSLLGCLAHGVPTITVAPPCPVISGQSPAAGLDHVPLTTAHWSLEHGEAVWYVPSADALALATAIAELRRDPGRRARLSEGARAYARRLSWPEIARRTRAHYEQALAGR